MRSFTFAAPRNYFKSNPPISRLSGRELEILKLVGEGKNSDTIARQMHLSFKTVEAHRSNISMIFKLCGAVLSFRASR